MFAQLWHMLAADAAQVRIRAGEAGVADAASGARLRAALGLGLADAALRPHRQARAARRLAVAALLAAQAALRLRLPREAHRPGTAALAVARVARGLPLADAARSLGDALAASGRAVAAHSALDAARVRGRPGQAVRAEAATAACLRTARRLHTLLLRGAGQAGARAVEARLAVETALVGVRAGEAHVALAAAAARRGIARSNGVAARVARRVAELKSLRRAVLTRLSERPALRDGRPGPADARGVAAAAGARRRVAGGAVGLLDVPDVGSSVVARRSAVREQVVVEVRAPAGRQGDQTEQREAENEGDDATKQGR